VEQLRFIKFHMDAGASAADAHRLLRQELSAGRLPAALHDSGERRPLVLLVERDSYAAELAEYFLRTEGYDVAIATDSTQAREQFEARSPDVVVVDLLISAAAGFQLLNDFAGRGTAQVIAVSAIDSSADAMHAGAAGFMRKPLEPLRLVSTMRDLLGTSALVRAARTHQAQA
jgi:DNA-binding NtrC family response regulator